MGLYQRKKNGVSNSGPKSQCFHHVFTVNTHLSDPWKHLINSKCCKDHSMWQPSPFTPINHQHVQVPKLGGTEPYKAIYKLYMKFIWVRIP